MTGQSLLHYQIIEKLGEGGMGTVYKAVDTRLSRNVVLKVLRKDQLSDPLRERRFFREAHAASSLNHPNIITIHDLASANGISFIVMEYVAGRPLDFLIPSGGLPLATLIHYATQIADALEAAHSAGIIHRDLKPANVMVTPAGLIKLLDFGLAKLTGGLVAVGASQASGAPSLTAEGSVIGTVCYMSPEQAAAKPLDLRSDIFSFGTLMYEMATGRKVFNQPSQVAALEALFSDSPVPPVQSSRRIPSALSEIIMRCLEKDPERRYPSARAVRNALLAVKLETDDPAAPVSDESAEGDAALESLSNASLRKAREHYEHAIQSGSHPSIYAGISEYYAMTALLGMREPSDAAPKAAWAAGKAIELDPTSERAHVSLGLLRANYDLRWKEAKPLVDWARDSHHKLRRALFYFRPLEMFDAAYADAQSDAAVLAWIALEQGDLTAAERHASRADLDSWIACWVRGWTLLARGRTREAIEVCQSAREFERDNAMIESALATAYVMHKQADMARRLVERPGWRPASFPIPYYVVTGQLERAFETGRTALQRRDPGLLTVMRLPLFRPYRTDPRYRELISALGL